MLLLQKRNAHSVPVNWTVRLTGTSLLNSLTGLPLTGLLVVQILNFVYSVPVNECLVNGNGVYYNMMCDIQFNSIYSDPKCMHNNNFHYMWYVTTSFSGKVFKAQMKFSFSQQSFLGNYTTKGGCSSHFVKLN